MKGDAVLMACKDEVLLDTLCGKIRGTLLGEAAFFRGIPYAETPRFQKPTPIRHWDGVLDATKQEQDCWQYGAFRNEVQDADNFYYREFRSERQFAYGESPMTLNIIAPRDAANCPVIVFIHGGGHETGTVGELPYGTSTEYAKRGILLVSVGYRLNVFSLYRSRNFGLHDQLAAVLWVHEFISAFGGDPERIILMGQSAGAMSITDLCLNQKLKGIVKGAVLMSGGGAVPGIVGPWTAKQSAAFWDKVQSRAGASSEAEMLALPPEQLWNAWYAVSRENRSFHLQQPGIDEEIIPDLPQKVLRRDGELDIPMIFGVTAQDFLPVVLYEMALSWGLRSSRKGKSPVYGYLFRRTPPGGDYRAFHAVDLWYLFGNMDKCWRPFGDDDRALSARMIDYVSAFARTGDPNAAGLPQWLPISPAHRDFLCFDVDTEGSLSPAQCRKLVWHTALKDPGPM